MWANLNSKMLEFLESVSLADLVKQHHAKQTSHVPAVAVLHDRRELRVNG